MDYSLIYLTHMFCSAIIYISICIAQKYFDVRYDNYFNIIFDRFSCFYVLNSINFYLINKY